MPEWLIQRGQDLLRILEANQYLGLPIFIGLEAAGAPSPVAAEIVVVGMGFQVYRGQANPWVVIASVVGSATLGVSILYWIARLVGRPLLDRYGRLLHISPDRMQRLERWFERYAVPVVVVGRVLPGVRIIIPAIAGVARGDFRLFVLSAALGNLLWALLYMSLGWALGDQVEGTLMAITDNPALGFGVVVGLLALAIVLIGFRLRRRILRRYFAGKPAPTDAGPTEP